jgi:hypothetical protein
VLDPQPCRKQQTEEALRGSEALMRTLLFHSASQAWVRRLALAGVKIEHWTAPTGARVYFIETRVIPILDVQIDFAAGGAFVPAGKAGLAGLTRSLLERARAIWTRRR